MKKSWFLLSLMCSSLLSLHSGTVIAQPDSPSNVIAQSDTPSNVETSYLIKVRPFEEVKKYCTGRPSCFKGDGQGPEALAFLMLGMKLTLRGDHFRHAYDPRLHAKVIGVQIPKDTPEEDLKGLIFKEGKFRFSENRKNEIQASSTSGDYNMTFKIESFTDKEIILRELPGAGRDARYAETYVLEKLPAE